MRKTVKIVFFSSLSALLLSACGGADSPPAAEPLLEPLAPEGWADASADFIGTDGEKKGAVAIVDAPTGILIRLDLSGLSHGWHGIHLHQVGDCSDHENGFMASGPHINPEGRAHGLLNPEGPDRGDLPNLYAGPDERASAEFFSAMVSVRPSEAAAATGRHPALDEDGFAVVIHANPDDHTTQPIGGAGPRVACAAIRP